MMNPEHNPSDLATLVGRLLFYRRRYQLLGDAITQLMFWYSDVHEDVQDTQHWSSVVDELHRVAEMWRVQSIETLEEIERRLLPIKEELGS